MIRLLLLLVLLWLRVSVSEKDCDLGGHHFCAVSKAVILPHHHIHLYLLQRIEQIALICVTALKKWPFYTRQEVAPL